jgi:hypothetical protein
MLLTDEDLEQIKEHKLSIEDVNEQILNFENGFKPIELYKPAVVGYGIRQYTEQEIETLISLYETEKEKYSIIKFVPASGAATRMFKDLYVFLAEYIDEEKTPLSSFPSVKTTIDNIEDFAFYNLLKNKMEESGLSISKCKKEKDYRTIIEYLLTNKGLNYGKYPKAWILFHKDKRTNLTAFEEHLEEAANYCRNNDETYIEFSISKYHSKGFNYFKKDIVPYYEKKNKIKYNITFSFQSPSTDTIAVNSDNTIAHDKEGNLIFRPSGHGALINNLNKITSDIIFIKNIDNVSIKYRKETYKYKKLLAGVLITCKQKINSLMVRLEKKEMSKQELVSIANMIKNQLNILNVKNYTEFKTLKQYQKYLFSFLNRPIRVCGMVKNNGDVGGGPYFIKEKDDISLQIIEGSQVNKNNSKQKEIFLAATHFNPVDLVISTKDYRGKKFNLLKFIDNSKGFISEKTYEDLTLKVQEKPGLWNGSMENWISIFVEVPIETFNPVKTVNDLLKDAHR